MKRVMFMAFLMVSGLALQAQEGFRAGINLAIPTGDAADVSGFSIGLDATYLWNISESFDAGVAAGFTNAFGKEIEIAGFGSIEVDDVQFLPIAAAGRFHATDKFRAGADLGYAIGISDGNDGGFYYRPMVGYGLNEKMELNLSYTGISLDGGTWSTIGLGLMYSF